MDLSRLTFVSLSVIPRTGVKPVKTANPFLLKF